jgi:tetratricopeptide (TPR) repeat protein
MQSDKKPMPIAMKKTLTLIYNLLILGWLSVGIPAFAQENGTLPQVKRLSIGPHPEHTRILVELSEAIPYTVSADFVKKKITLIFDNATAGPNLVSRSFNDNNLEYIGVRSRLGSVQLTLRLRNANTRFFHFLENVPPRVALDLEGRNTPFTKAKVGKSSKNSSAKPQQEPAQDDGESSRNNAKIPGLDQQQIEKIVNQAETDKLRDGSEDYKKALTMFQIRKYDEAVTLFDKFTKDYPESKFLDHIFYLKAEAEFFSVFNSERSPVFEKAMEAYLRAVRSFPDSQFFDHALYKIAYIYDQMNYVLEARNLYQEGMNKNSRSIYNNARESGLASMLMKVGKYDEAYAAFNKFLKKSPQDLNAKSALFDIAQHYYDEKNYDQAIVAYEDAAKRWPRELAERPEIDFNMGEIYFAQRKFDKAREHYFDLINLNPGRPIAHTAINRIGDSYLLEGKHMDALSVFDESSKRRPGSAPSQYSIIRMADIGVKNPTLPVQDIVFKVEPYFNPLKTYDEISHNAKSIDILAEVTLSRGIALLREQNFLKAFDEFKKLLPLGPKSKFYDEAKKYLRQTLIQLVDVYSREKGYLPILYAYSDFMSLSLGQVKNLRTLMQLGEAYQNIGMYQESVKFYERVKRADSRESFADRIFLNLGEIHLSRGANKEGELVARSFLKNYPRSTRVPSALKLLAQAQHNQNQPEEAIKTYRTLLSKSETDVSLTFYKIAQIHEEQKEFAKAAQEYGSAIANFDRAAAIKIPDYIMESYYKLGMSYYQNDQFSPALKALDAAIQQYPKHPLREWAELLRGESYNKMNNLEQAQTQFSNLAKGKDFDELMRRAALSRSKVLEWEKKIKDTL